LGQPLHGYYIRYADEAPTMKKIISYLQLITSAVDRCIQDTLTLTEKFVGLGIRVGLMYGLYKLVGGGLLEQFISNF